MATKIGPLIVVVGPTASGKSAVAMELAQKFDGEIICADARTIYRGMDIGTAKPSMQDQSLVPHHLLDIIEPNQSFSAAGFKKLAVEAIEDISKRKKLPILVGGTGLYVDGVIFDFSFRQGIDAAKRADLQKLSVEELQMELAAEGMALPENSKNPRHLIRAIETGGQPSESKPLRENTLVIGLEVETAELKEQIKKRVATMIEGGLRQEVNSLVNTYGWEAPGLNTIGYKEWHDLFNGTDLKESKVEAAIVKNTNDYAKRQKTWFKRNKSIQWLSDRGKAVDISTTFLTKTEQ